MTKLGLNLKNLLNQTKLTESELARRTGVAQQVINRIASGKNTNPKLDTLSQIASYFMVSISQLVGDWRETSAACETDQQADGFAHGGPECKCHGIFSRCKIRKVRTQLPRALSLEERQSSAAGVISPLPAWVGLMVRSSHPRPLSRPHVRRRSRCR